jgi:hypothetical protein
MSRTRSELVSALGEQLNAIKTSSAAFDAGDNWEAKRLATAAHIILYDKGRTVSLLTQLGVKERINFISSSVPANPNNSLAETPLVIVHYGPNGPDYLPLCKIGGGPSHSDRCHLMNGGRSPSSRTGKRQH